MPNVPIRTVAVGYNAHEVSIPQLENGHFVVKGEIVNIDPSLELTIHRQNANRPVVAVSLGPHLVGAAAPHVNPGHTATSALGGIYRFGREIPANEYPKHSRKFRRFVQRWLRRHLTPFNSTDDLSFETWINSAPYTQARKDELKNKYYSMNFGWHMQPREFKKFFRVKSFVKDETYVDYKHSRSINSRDDFLKCIFGPIMQAIANYLMKSRHEFIKYVPVHERPQYIIDLLHRLAVKFKSSDYTSFEAHFNPQIMQDCEMQLFRYMLQNVDNGDRMIAYIEYAKYLNPNMCFFKDFLIKVVGKRMSGEMDTSLSNGFSNLMFLLYSAEANGIDPDSVLAVIEGDDALCVVPGEIPDSFYKDFGLSVKIEQHDHLEYASFCGLVFDLKDRAIVTDVFDAIATFGWTTQNYLNAKPEMLKSILRCKALSMAYQYKNCPILSKFSFKMLQLTSDVKIDKIMMNPKFIDSYYLDILQQAIEYSSKNGLIPDVQLGTRNLVESLYGINIADQLKIEKQIDDIVDLSPFDCPLLLKHAPKSYQQYYERYVIQRQTRDYNCLDLIFPALHQPYNTIVL